MAFRFESLEIWKEAINFSSSTYKITRQFPKEELFSLSSQLNRAAISISANIAEGSASDSVKEFRMFLNISIRSGVEVISELFIAKERSYLSDEEFGELYNTGELLIRRISSFRNQLKL
ncbi:MAG: four helix bundle protein [Patescibacteria group bacterium]